MIVSQERKAHTEEELQEYLHCWTLPGGRLTPDQTRALLSWSGTPDAEREGLAASLAGTEQQVPAEPLAPNQRRGHVSWLDRLKYFLGKIARELAWLRQPKDR